MKQERLMKIVLAPHMSEKAAMGGEHGLYVFEVLSSSNKKDVKESVELLFKVKVKAVRIVNVKTKPKRFGSVAGRSKAWKKAYVTLEAGQQIDFTGTAQ